MKTPRASCLSSLLMLWSGCSYPAAGLVVETASDGQKVVRLTYPSPKLSLHAEAYREGKWAVAFAVNDYKQISFPPPGAITDNKWLYYFVVLDSELRPLTAKPLRFDQRDRGEQRLSGETFALVATEEGFAVVYLALRGFLLQRFGPTGAPLGGAKEIVGVEDRPGVQRQCLAIAHHAGTLFFLLAEPGEGSSFGPELNLIKHRLGGGTTDTVRRFLPHAKEWLEPGAAAVHFSGSSMQVAWPVQVETSRNAERGTYTTGTVFQFAQCSLEDDTCRAASMALKLDGSGWPVVRFLEQDGKLSVAIQEGAAVWQQRLGEDGMLAGPPVRLDEAQKQQLVPGRYAEKALPGRITVGPSAQDPASP